MKPFSILDQVMTKSERKRLRHVGLKQTLKPRKNYTSLERKYYLMLKSLGVDYVPQYPLGGRFYDIYIPDYNLLIELDGTFWHPLKEEDCKYVFQKKNMRVDLLKTKMAKDAGIRLIRIREDEPITTQQMKELIWG